MNIKNFFNKSIGTFVVKHFGGSLTDALVDELSVTGTQININDAYRTSVWVYACSRAVALNLSSIPLVIKNVQSGDIVQSGNSYDLFNNPNISMTEKLLIEGISTLMDIRGEAFIILDGFVRGRGFTKMWLKKSENMTALIKDCELVGWKYEEGNKRLELPPEQVIHFKYYNPFDDIRGLSPVTVARLSFEHEIAAKEYNASFFKNSAIPPLALISKDFLTHKQKSNILAKWNNNHRGFNKAFNTALLEGNMDIKSININQKDALFLEALDFSREEICAIFRVPPSEVGIFKYANYANSEQQSTNFWTKTLIPKAVYIKDVLNSKYFKVYDPEHEMDFDFSGVDVLQNLLSNKMDIAIKMFTVGYPLETIDTKLNLFFLSDNMPSTNPNPQTAEDKINELSNRIKELPLLLKSGDINKKDRKKMILSSDVLRLLKIG